MLFCRSAADGYEHHSCSNGQIQGKSCARWQLEHCGRMKTILLIYIFYNDYWQDIKAEPVDVEVLDVFSLWRASSSSALDVTNFYRKKSSLISQFPLPTSYHFRGAWEGEWSCSPPGSCWRLPPDAPSRPPARPGRRSSPVLRNIWTAPKHVDGNLIKGSGGWGGLVLRWLRSEAGGHHCSSLFNLPSSHYNHHHLYNHPAMLSSWIAQMNKFWLVRQFPIFLADKQR